MLRVRMLGLLLAGVLLAPVGYAEGQAACAKCHDADEFAAMTAADIAANMRDTSISSHKKLAELTDEQVQAIAAELAGS
jgi:hypothetical protein